MTSNADRIERKLRSSMNLGVLHFDQVANKLDQEGVLSPHFKIGQKVWYITTSKLGSEYVPIETEIVSILVDKESFKYTFLLEDGRPYTVDDDSIGRTLHPDHLTAFKHCAMLNDINVIVRT